MLDWDIEGETKYKLIIAVRGDNFIIQIACLHQLIYLFCFSVMNVLCECTQYWYVSVAFIW